MTCDTIQDTLFIARQVCTDTIHMVSCDCLTMDILEKSQKFYSDSFNNIMMLIGILVAITGVIVAIIAIFVNKKYSQAKKYNKDTKEEMERIKEHTNKIVSDFNKRYDRLSGESDDDYNKRITELVFGKGK